MAGNDVVLIQRPVEWRSIPGYEGLYSVTCTGRVWSHRKRKWRKAVFDARSGYFKIELPDGFYFIHQLVMFAWGPPQPSPDHEINHKDLDKQHNHIDNLEWLTRSQNVQHAVINGHAGNGVLILAEVLQIRERYANGESQYRLARAFGVHRSTIGLIVNRKTWWHV